VPPKENPVTLAEVVSGIGEVLVRMDASRKSFCAYRAGVKEYGVPQLLKLLYADLNRRRKHYGAARLRSPSMLAGHSMLPALTKKKSGDSMTPGYWGAGEVEMMVARLCCE
jgi:hypothetical protein